MSDMLKKLTDLKQKVENLRAKLQRARGASEQLSKELDHDWDCQTLNDARSLLKQMQSKRIKLKTELDKKFSDFEDEWSEVLDDAEKLSKNS